MLSLNSLADMLYLFTHRRRLQAQVQRVLWFTRPS